MKNGIVYKGDGIFDYCGWPTVARIDKNILAVAYSGNRLRHVCSFGKTMVCYSYDEGKTWSKPMAVVDTKFDDRDGGIVANGKQVLVSSFNNTYKMQIRYLVRQVARYGRNDRTDNEENLIKTYIEMNKSADEKDVCSSLSISEDQGKTFSTRIIMPITSPHGPKVLSDGTYVWVGRNFSIDERDRTEGLRDYNFLEEGIYVMYSKDGYAWSEPERLPNIENVVLSCEPDVIQINNGELLVHVRVVHKKDFSGDVESIYQIVSSHNRTQWSNPAPLGIDAIPSHLMRHSSGVIIMSAGRRVSPIAQQVFLSYDEGKTWSKPYSIDTDAPDEDMGYPSTVELNDGSLMTVYYQHDKIGEKNYIKYTVWTLDELK